MSWSEILNHEHNLQRFQRSASRDKLASTYLFVGPPGVGKRTFALKLAQALLCETNDEKQLQPCGSCPACQQVDASTHPDLIQIQRPKGKNVLPVDLFIGDREHRNRQGLCREISLKPFRGGRKIAIIDDADFLNMESANCLLKTLEEPPPRSVLILVGTSEQQQLKTIVSRSQVIRFGPLSNEEVLTILNRTQLIDTEETNVSLSDLAEVSGGSVERAIQLADPEILDFRQSLFDQLGTMDPARDDYAKNMLGFIDGAGKDASAKRNRTRMVADFAVEYFRRWLIDESDHERNDIAVEAIERSLDVQRQISANANQANVVEAWLIDLGRICRREFVSAH